MFVMYEVYEVVTMFALAACIPFYMHMYVCTGLRNKSWQSTYVSFGSYPP